MFSITLFWLLLHVDGTEKAPPVMVSSGNGVVIVAEKPTDPISITLDSETYDALRKLTELLPKITNLPELPLSLRHQGDGFDIDRSKLGPWRNYNILWALENLRQAKQLDYRIEMVTIGKNEVEFFHVTAPPKSVATKKPDE